MEADVGATEDEYRTSARRLSCNTASQYETTQRAFQEIPELRRLAWGSCEYATALHMINELDVRNCQGAGYTPMRPQYTPGLQACPSFYPLAERIPLWFSQTVWTGGRRARSYHAIDQSWIGGPYGYYGSH